MSTQTNLPATREPKPQLVAGAPVAALVPQTLEEAFRLAGALAASGMAPRGMDKPEQIMVAIMAGAELGLAPFQSLQSFAVVNGRPTLWGDGLMAVVKARGVKVREWNEGEGDAMVAYCEVTRPDNGEVTLGEFSVSDAKKAGLWGKQGPWQQYPKRMLKMRARVALRDGCADMLRGIQIREEVEDYQPIRDVTGPASGTGMRARLEARAAEPAQGFNAEHVARQTEIVDNITGEVRETTVAEDLDGDAIPSEFGGAPESADQTGDAFPGDKPTQQSLSDGLGLKTGSQVAAEQAAKEPEPFDPLTWAADFNADLESMDIEAIEAALADPAANGNFDALQAKSPGTAKALNEAIVSRKAALSKGGAQ
jgi:hypothetical protein